MVYGGLYAKSESSEETADLILYYTSGVVSFLVYMLTKKSNGSHQLSS